MHATLPHWKAWPPGVPHEIEIDPRTLWDVLNDRAQANPHGSALHFLGRDISWQALVRETRQLAGGLQSIGLAPGDRVVLLAQNCPQFVIAFHAVLCCGAVVVPVNPMNKVQELAHCVRDSGARFAITSQDLAAELARVNDLANVSDRLQHMIVFAMDQNLNDVPKIWRDWLCSPHKVPELSGGKAHAWTDLIDGGFEPNAVACNGNDLALLMYTSGTTGNPKACMHTHRTIMPNAMLTSLWHGLTKDDVSLVALPMFHITGLVGGLLGAIYPGAKIVLLPRWDRRIARTVIVSQGVTNWTNIPTMVVDLLADPDLTPADLASIRHIGGGGAAMPAAISNRLKNEFGLEYVEGYGLTETAAPSHSNTLHAPRPQCLGIPIINTRACVVDPDTLAEMPQGEPGEILVSGPQVFQGYWNNPEASTIAFVERDGRRWFRTGDLGWVDADGYYYISDRIKRMINASGFKVWPAEVEALLHQHPAVQEACIIARSDAYRGQSVKALIVLKPSARGQTTDKDITDWARENMAAYKVPKYVDFVESLPKGGTGKVMWRDLQAAQDRVDQAA